MNLNLLFLFLVAAVVKSYMLSSLGAGRIFSYVTRKPQFATAHVAADNVATKMKNAFERLKNGPDQLYYCSFLSLPGIQQLISRDVLGDKDLERAWLKVVLDTEKPANFKQFLAINDEISNMFGREESPTADGPVCDYVWDPAFPLKDKFRGDALEHIQQYFNAVATRATKSKMIDDKKGYDMSEDGIEVPKKKLDDESELISFGSFAQWSDVTEILEEAKLDPVILNQLWLEAVEYKYMMKDRKNNASQKRKKSYLSTDMKQDIEKKNLLYNTDRTLMIDFDTFLRLNYRLDEVVDDIMSHPTRQAEKQLETFYRQEFQCITNQELLMSYEQLLHWRVVQEMLSNKAITEKDLLRVWDVLPHQFLPVDAPVRLFAPRPRSDVPGITEDSFIALNHSLQDSLRK
eukprot:gene14753-16919_t